ncbi:hypothetical protein Tco_1085133, partial [Tanacetum coccineum]
PDRAVIDAAHHKRDKYEANCANTRYNFLPFSFSSLGELEKDAVIRQFSVTQDIRARVAVYIFNRINFAIAKGVVYSGPTLTFCSSPLTQTGMIDFTPRRAVIEAAQLKRVKYEAKCANIGYGFLAFSFFYFGELEKDAVTLLKWI